MSKLLYVNDKLINVSPTLVIFEVFENFVAIYRKFHNKDTVVLASFTSVILERI